MNKTIKILTVLLAAQLLLAVGVGLTDRGITVRMSPSLVALIQKRSTASAWTDRKMLKRLCQRTTATGCCRTWVNSQPITTR